VLERSRVLNPRAAVIVMTAYAALETAIAALRRGASDYLEKPFSVDLLKERVQSLLQYRETIWKDRLVQRALQPRAVGHSLVGESDAIRALREQIMLAARTPSNVLITGESGVGKELVARAVHDEGTRHDASFVAINCGAIPEALLESQLFGHLRGAFTTAVQANQDCFVAANQGTLFSTRSGEMPLPLQVKLLRVIEDKCVLPVGDQGGARRHPDHREHEPGSRARSRGRAFPRRSVLSGSTLCTSSFRPCASGAATSRCWSIISFTASTPKLGTIASASSGTRSGRSSAGRGRAT